MSRLKLDGLPEQLHRSLSYISSLPLYPKDFAVLVQQDYRWLLRVHLSFRELGFQVFMIYEVDPHSTGALRIWDAFMHLLVPLGLYLFLSKPFVLLA